MLSFTDQQQLIYRFCLFYLELIQIRFIFVPLKSIMCFNSESKGTCYLEIK
jgi:cytochrome c oxidase assembly protein Cox11